MLQEESCKKLALMLTKAFGQSQMREFAKNCDIDLDRQIKLDEQDIQIRDRYMQRLMAGQPPTQSRAAEMYEEPGQNEAWDVDGQGETYMGPPPEQSQAQNRGRIGQKKNIQPVSKVVQKQNSSIKQQQSTAMQRMVSTGKLQQQSSGINKQYTRKTTNMSGFGGGGGATKRTGFDVSQQQVGEVEYKKAEKPPQYIKIGDIIILKIAIEVFQSDIELAEAVRQLEGEMSGKNTEIRERKFKEERGRQTSVKLNKIIDEPNFTFKGMITCESINNLNLQVIPKRTEENTNNAIVQFKKCLFIVENKYRIHYKQLYQAKCLERDKILETRKKTAERSDFQALSKIDQVLKHMAVEIDALEQQKSLEDANNAYMMQQKVGTKVQYGEEIQFKHIFTDKYLTVDQNEMSDDHGNVRVNFQELSPSAWLRIIPAKDELAFRSEILISSKDAKQFTLKIGGDINVRDAFYLLNQSVVNNEKYYIHVDESKVANPKGILSVLEVNAGLKPTKLNCKMFLSYQDHQSNAIYSGDVVRLLHVESNCYAQTAPRISGSRGMFSNYPDFLNAEISELKNKQEDWEGDFKTLNFGENDSVNLDDSNQDQKDERMAQDFELKQNKNLYLEAQTRQQSFTDSCFEIQNIDSFKGGTIELGTPFRLKQTVTEMFMAIDAEGLYLTLRDDPLQQRSTVFKGVGIQNDQNDLKNNSKFYIETYNERYIQIYQDLKDEITKAFQYVDYSAYEMYNDTTQSSTLSLIAGMKQLSGEITESNMIFRIEKVDPKLARITFECNSFLQSICSFWEMLNTWAVVKNNRADALYQYCYDGDAAVEQEDLLTAKTIELTIILKKMMRMLEMASDRDDLEYHELQRHLGEQRIPEVIMLLIEIIYYKTVPPEFRHKPFKPDRLLKFKIYDLSHESYLCYQIAKDRLDDLNMLLLQLIVMLVRNNVQGCERLSKFSDTLFNQFRRQPNPFESYHEGEYAKKIFCHMYKCANYLYNDRASVIKTAEGINQNMPEVFTKVQQLSRWLNLLETVQYTDSNNQNITQQIRYLKIISSFCKTQEKNKFKYHYQIQIVQRLFHYEANIPLWVGTQRRTDKSLRPYVYFARLQGESSDSFLQMNGHIANGYSQSLNQEGNRKFDIIFDLSELTIRYEDIPTKISPYFEYIAGVMQLYAAMCAGRNREAITIVRLRIGVSDTFLLDQCTSHHRQQVQIIEKLKPSYLALAKVLILDHQPFNIWSDLSKNRVFFWKNLEESELHNTIYRWEKIKHGEDDSNTYGTTNNQIRLSTLRIRQIITDYMKEGPPELIEFLYSSEQKQYSEVLVNPKVAQMSCYIEAAIACLESENLDTVFAFEMMDLAIKILLAVSCFEFIDYFSECWIYKIIRVVHRVPGCILKEQKLIKQALTILKVISDHRLTMQMLQFMKHFKEFEETNRFSHVNFDIKQMDIMFKNLFVIQQYNIDVPSLQILFLMLDPTRKIMQDVHEEMQDEKDKIRRHQRRAITKNTQEDSPRQATKRDKDGNVIDASLLGSNKGDESQGKVVNLNQTKKEEEKIPLATEDVDLQEQIKALLSNDEDKLKAVANKNLPIDEYLLFFSLMKTQLRIIPAKALKIVMDCSLQRQTLLEEICKIELIISENDRSNYKQIHFFKERLKQVTMRLVQEEYTYLLFKVGQHEQMKEKILECSNVIKQVTRLIAEQKEQLQRIKIQNIIRQIDFVDYIISKLMKSVYYDRALHKNLFDICMEFFFQFSKNNNQTQLLLKKHLAYLTDLAKWDIECGKVLAQVIQSDKLKAFGMKFHQFILRKILDEKIYKPQLFDYLTVVSQNEPTLKTFFLSQIVADSSFRNRLYMKKQNEWEKIDIVKEVVRKRLIFGKGEDADKELANDILKVDLHMAICTFLAHSAIDNVYGLKQIRRLVELERLMDALLAQSVPFMLKAVYFRLFYAGFLQQIGNEQSLTINYAKFLQIIRFVVLYDLEQFHEYLNGLVVTQPTGAGESENDPEWKRSRQRVVQELDRQTKETSDKLNSRKTFKQKNEEKEMRAELSSLNAGSRPYPFLQEKNQIEYWTYLCSDHKQTGQSDGLLIFIRDMYKSLNKKQDQWEEELKDSTSKLYEALLRVTDSLDSLRDMFKQFIINIDSIMLALSEATYQIPQKANKIGAITTTENEYQDEKDDEEKTDKIMVITRDYIIAKNLQIRESFGIKTQTSDVLVHPYFIKRKIKDICGNDVNFYDIEHMIRNIMQTSQKKQELQAVVGIELGQPGHIRTRHTAKLHEDKTRFLKPKLSFIESKFEEDTSELFNFKEFEILLKSKLAKAGFKPPIIRRERVTEETNFSMQMDQDEMSQGVQGDLQHFIMCYREFLNRFKDSDEIQDLACKILQKFNLLFIQGSKQNESSIELSEYKRLKQFLKNLVHCIAKEDDVSDVKKEHVQEMAVDIRISPQPDMTERKNFLLVLSTKLVSQLSPENFEEQIRLAAATRHKLLQRMLTQCGLLKIAYKYVNPNQPNKTVSLSLRLINSLIENDNKDVLETFYHLVLESPFNMLVIVKNRIKNCVDRVLNIGKQVPQPPSKTLVEKVYQLQIDVREPELMNQPFYVPDAFTIENKIYQEETQDQINELLFLLQFCQKLVKGLPVFQVILESQQFNEQVDLVFVIGECLIRITEIVHEHVYTNFQISQCLEEIFRTLRCMADGQIEIQGKFAKWRALQKSLNFYLEQNFVYYGSDSVLSRNKIKIMSQSLQLLSLCVQTEDNLNSVINEINLDNLKCQLTTIFKFKIGGTPHRDHAYRTQKFCTHKGFCLENEYCFFQSLVTFDLLTFDCAYNIFYVLQQANLLLPIEKLGKIRFNVEAGNLFLMGRKKFINQIYWESFEHITEIVGKIQKTTSDLFTSETKENTELNNLLELIFILQNHIKIERQYYKQQEDPDIATVQADELFSGIDVKQKLTEKDKEKAELEKLLRAQNEFVKEAEEEYQYNEIFLDLIKKSTKAPNLFGRYCCMKPIKASSSEVMLRKIFCFSWLSSCRQQKIIYDKQDEKIKFLFEKRKLAKTLEARVKIDNFLTNREIEIARKREYTGPFTGSLTKQILQTTSYVFDQFKYDYIYRYMLSQISSVEVTLNHIITKEQFQIPNYCQYISKKDQDQILFNLTKQNPRDNTSKMAQFLREMPLIKMKMKQNQALARVSPILYKITQKSDLLTTIVLASSIIINLVFLQSYTYRFEIPKPPPLIIDQAAWLKEIFNVKGYVNYTAPPEIYIDPWSIKMKTPALGMVIDLCAILNTVASILAFILMQMTQNPEQDYALSGGIIKEEEFTTGSLAQQLPKQYASKNTEKTSRTTNYLLNLLTNKTQQKNLAIILMTSLGLVNQDQFYPFIMLFLLISELEVIRSLITVLLKRIYNLLVLFGLVLIMIFLVSYYRFLNQSCLEVTECFTDLLRGMIDLPNSGWLELCLAVISILVMFNLFLGLIIDSIAERRMERQQIQELLSLRCFICDLSKLDFETAKIDFGQHLEEQHNPMAYLYYFMWVSDQNESQNISKITRTVKEMIIKQQCSFIPQRDCLVMQKKQKSD